MDRDNLLVVGIGSVLVALIAIPALFWRYKETHRPTLHAARVVTATARDRVCRDGARHLGPDDAVEIAVAVQLGRPGEEPYWLAPCQDLVFGEEHIPHMVADGWPEEDRVVRVNWFTVESALLGGELTPEAAAERLRYRSFLAPELGRELQSHSRPEAHNDDSLGDRAGASALNAGTLRLYARVEVVAAPDDVAPLQSATTLVPDRLHDPGFPAIHRSAAVPSGIDPRVGELFLLPGFEPLVPDGSDWDAVTEQAFGRPFTALVAERLVTSSRTFAAVAVSGTPLLPEDRMESLGPLEVTEDALLRRGQRLRWGDEVQPGDLLREKDHWLVLAADDGDLELDAADEVLHCWRSPPAAEPLGSALRSGVSRVELLRCSP